MLAFYGVLLLSSFTLAQWEITPPEITLAEGGGLRMGIPSNFPSPL